LAIEVEKVNPNETLAAKVAKPQHPKSIHNIFSELLAKSKTNY
jgi:DNA-binding XRE family transcriptional regulator